MCSRGKASYPLGGVPFTSEKFPDALFLSCKLKLRILINHCHDSLFLISFSYNLHLCSVPLIESKQAKFESTSTCPSAFKAQKRRQNICIKRGFVELLPFKLRLDTAFEPRARSLRLCTISQHFADFAFRTSYQFFSSFL